MPEVEQPPSSIQEKIGGMQMREQTNEDMEEVLDMLEEDQSPDGAQEALSTEDVDNLLKESEREEIISRITPERIAQEWEQLSEAAQSAVLNASDEKFNEITEKYKNIPDTKRKASSMIIMRRLIKSNNPLASKIMGQQEGRMQKAA